MSETANALYATLGFKGSEPRVVLHGDNTISESPARASTSDAAYSDSIDTLFGAKPSYWVIKKERPSDRMILWMSLQGQRPNEIATQMRMTAETVRRVQKQPWFQDAFCKLAAEMGRDAVSTMLKAEALPAIERTIELAKNADSDAVKLAANKELLDRFLGKPVVKAEIKSEAHVDQVVYNAADLLAEQKRLAEQLRSRGIGTN